MLKQLTHAVWVHDPGRGARVLHRSSGWSFARTSPCLARQLPLAQRRRAGPAGRLDHAHGRAGAPVFDDDTRAQIQALLAKGAAGLFFATDDVKAATRR